jgi:2-polyprenyl-6-methoxyphenol hydroxylase-like FAD-dependent oxidoreductase
MRSAKAIVVGSGIAGLVSAQILSKHFATVELIDRDTIPTTAGPRKGTPQGHHFHGLLPGGLKVLNDLFPGFDQDLQAGGALTPEPHEFYAYGPEGKSFSYIRHQPEPSDPIPGFPKMHMQTRHLLEHCLRKRVEQSSNITTRYACAIRDPLIRDGRIAGVVVHGSGEEIEADLVIDASGRVGRTPRWLTNMNYALPAESHINCDFAYTTVMFRPKDPGSLEDAGFFVMPAASGRHTRRSACLVKTESGDWLASLSGRLGDHPPEDYEGYLKWAETLVDDRLLTLIRQADPISEPIHFKFPRSIRRHYEKLKRFPEGLLPLGDGVCQYNPYYGQGMSAACRQAVALDQVLSDAADKPLDGLWQKYLPAAYEETRSPWLYAAILDFAHKGTTGQYPKEEQRSVELLVQYGQQSLNGDKEAARLVTSISSMMQPLSAIHAV